MAEQRANKIPAASPDTAVSPAAALPLGRVHSVETGGTVDGPGIRYVLFLQGCPLRCVYCHNPDTWDCGGGRTMTVDEVVTDIRRYRAFIQNGGVTLSGGEPLLQADFAAAVLDACRREGIHTAVDTSGAVPLAACRHAVDAADLLLLDMKAGTDALCAQITGQDLSRPLELLRYCEEQNKPVWIRHVLVPGLTLTETNLRALGALLHGHTCIKRVQPLPFHQLGAFKWEELHVPYTLKDTPVPSSEEIVWARALLKEYDLPME